MDGYTPTATTVYMFLPHEVLHCLAEHKYAFDSLILGNTSSASRQGFWDHVKTLMPWKNHPIFAHCEDNDIPLHKVVPLTIHGDGAQMFSEQDVFVFSISSFWGCTGILEDVLLHKLPLCMIPEAHMRSDCVFGIESN